jgi:protein TonB
MPRMFKIVSIAAHVIVVGSAFLAQLVAVGPLPVPHAPLTFVGTIPIVIKDVPLPPPAPRATAPIDASRNLAPIEAPSEIVAESPHDPPPPQPVSGFVDGGVDLGGRLEPVAPLPTPPPPPVPPQTPRRLVGGMEPPRRVVNVDPVYPQIARAARVEGVVILEATIDARGRVVDVRVLRSVPLLDQAAMDAVRQWIYTPTLLNGAPVPIVMTVTVNFRLQDR